MLRPIVGAGMVLVTPGIRPAGAEAGDQKRVMTPAAAIAAGADYLVVGRPIIAAPDPKAAAEAIVAEIARRDARVDVEEDAMAKGYWIPHLDVSDPEGYKAYMAATPQAHHKYGGRALVRGGTLRGGRRPRPLPQRAARIPGLRHRARLLPLAGIPARASRCACRIRSATS